MREGWTYKKMSEVFDLQMGKTPDRKTPSYFGGNNVWVSIRDLDGKEIGESNEHITDTAVTTTNIRKVKKGTVIMSFKLTVGKCAICTKDLYTNEAIMAFNLKEGYNIIPDFLYYYLSNYNWKGANKAVMGMTLNKATISQQVISYPPLSEQQSIVAELDKINELISLKKAQLSDLDNLAQSIFYDMFGDPIVNEKGWEVKMLKEIGRIITGNTPSKAVPEYYDDNFLEWIKTDNIEKNQLYATEAKEYLSEKGANCGRVVNKGSLLVACIAGSLDSIGKACVTDRRVAFNQQINAIVPYEIMDILFLYHLITRMKGIIQERASTGMKHILTKSVMEEIVVPLPPLSLQQEFAKRIELIEQQKAQISSTIKDLETLLASRMQYWFD